MLEGRILVSAIMVVVFGGAVLLSFTYAPDARFLPLVVGIPGLLLAIAQLINEMRAHPRIKIFPEEHRREVKMFAWFITFVAGLVLFGFLYAGPALVAAYRQLHEEFRNQRSARARLREILSRIQEKARRPRGQKGGQP